MIIIVSNKNDWSTNDVIDWLTFFNKKVVRLNGEDFFDEENAIRVDISNDSTKALTKINENEQIDLKKANAIWFRRDSYFHFKEKYGREFSYLKGTELYDELSSGLYQEFLKGKEAALCLISNDTKKLGNYKITSLNKIEVLNLAKKHGMKIPNTSITNRKSELLDFYKSCKGNIITKAIKDGLDLRVEDDGKTINYSQYTEEITEESLKNIPESFFPSLFQEKVEKEYEIRTFYLKGTCYSMAIFSQLDSGTSVDFRMYNLEKGNRNVPFNLPKPLEAKIKNLMTDLKLDTGSIDFIKSKKGEYLFLEVNPVGQYGMTSTPCNYKLDKIIAEHLI